MTDADRAECEAVWEQVVADLRATYAPTVVDQHRLVMKYLPIAKRKWENAAANAKLDEAARIADRFGDYDLGATAETIRALKQE